MTLEQVKLIDSVPFIKHVKDHRKCYFMPHWMRDGHKSEAHWFHYTATPAEKFLAISNPDHPRHDLARQAERLAL